MTFTNWRNSTVLSLTIHWIFAIGESHIGESPIGEIQVTRSLIKFVEEGKGTSTHVFGRGLWCFLTEVSHS